MPRIPNSTIIRAYRQHSLLPLLLPECRTVESARNELRWLQEHVASTTEVKHGDYSQSSKLLKSMCHARSRGTPLQYIIGDQPFGDLRILCQKNVLIPRAETETFTLHTSRLILNYFHGSEDATNPRQLCILDLCSGSGAIALLLHALLAKKFPKMAILGIDLSLAAVRLASKNIQHNLRLGVLLDRARTEINFRQGNVLSYGESEVPCVEEVLRTVPGFSTQSGAGCDVIVSNPPYIAHNSFWDGTTARSVRIFEPKLALVPPTITHPFAGESLKHEDVFYYDLFRLAMKLDAKLIVLECGSRLQACRVARICEDTANTYYRHEQLAFHVISSTELEAATNVLDSGPCAVIIYRPVLERHHPTVGV